MPQVRRERVRRPRLDDLLDRALAGSLTLVSAPAGFGKTTLLSDWARQRAGSVAWLSLEPEDDEAGRFFSYLIASIQEVEPGVGAEALALLRAPQPTPLATILTDLINDLARLDEQQRIVVLDDYHVIASEAIHHGIVFLLDHVPRGMHLVLATRADPPLPLARLRGGGQLAEVRAAELRFVTDEVGAFLQSMVGRELSPETIAIVEQRTEGWGVGVQLVGLSLRGRPDAQEFVAALGGSQRYVLDYLSEEVFARQAVDVQTFLLWTSVLDRLCGELCDALTGGHDGRAMLGTIERANLFLFALDDERRWYRYHHLFAEVLQARLRQTQPQVVPELHRRASAWFEQQGLIEEAVEHALTGGDFTRAADLIEQVGDRAWDEGQNALLMRWIDGLPTELVRARPKLCLLQAWLFSAFGRLAEIERRLRDALGEGVADATPTADVIGEAAAIRAGAAAYHGDAERAVALATAARDALTEDHRLRPRVMLILGDAHLIRGEVREAVVALTAATDRVTRDDPWALLAWPFLAEVRELQGQLREAEQICHRVLAMVRASGRERHFVSCYAHSGLARLEYEWNDFQAAAEHLAVGFDLTRLGTTERAGVALYVTAARMSAAQGEWARAFATADEGERYASRAGFAPSLAPFPALRARLWLAQGNVAAAANWADGCGLDLADPEAGLPRPYPHEFEYLALARVRTAQGQPAAALALLERLLQAATDAGRMGRAIEIHLLRALALAASEQHAAAVNGLEAAIALAEPEGYLRVFWDEGPAVIALLRQAASRGIARAYVAELLRASPRTDGSRPRLKASIEPLRAGHHGASTAVIEPLSDREREVLRLLAAGKSNAEIAAHLVVSANTVKTHLRNVYGKLAATNRTEAAARAREAGLL